MFALGLCLFLSAAEQQLTVSCVGGNKACLLDDANMQQQNSQPETEKGKHMGEVVVCDTDVIATSIQINSK